MWSNDAEAKDVAAHDNLRVARHLDSLVAADTSRKGTVCSGEARQSLLND
jgi:hypothetical protein